MRAHLGTPEVVIAEALRERCFGDWEGAATGNYARVWAADEVKPRYAGGNVETAAPVLDRSTAFIVDLERRYSGRDILLVSHGDTLQIPQAGFLRMNPSQHRSLPELKTAEIRQLRLDARPPAPASADRLQATAGSYCNALADGDEGALADVADEDVADEGVGEDVVGAGVGEDVAGAGVGDVVAGAGVGDVVAGRGVGDVVAGRGVGEDVAGGGVGDVVAGGDVGEDVVDVGIAGVVAD